jgi:hypothetical protein
MEIGRRLGMVLSGKDRPALDREALDRAVVEVDLGDPAIRRQTVGIDGEAVILAGDRHLAGQQVLHRLVAAVVAELELEGAAAHRQSEQLMTEADAEDRRAGRGQLAHRVDDRGQRLGIARSVR